MKNLKILIFILTFLLVNFETGFANYSPAEYKSNILLEKGIILGKSSGLDLNSNITRAEVARLISSAKNLKASNKSKNFKDVKSSHWASGYINSMVDLGYISGYPDNTFKPNNNITYSEFISIVVRANSKYGLKNSSNWKKQFVDYADSNGFLEDVNIDSSDYDRYINRGDAFIIIYNSLFDSPVSNLKKETNSNSNIPTIKDSNGNNISVNGKFLDFEDELLTAINKYRKENGVGELKKGSGEFSDFTKIRAVEISLSFSHSRPNPKNKVFIQTGSYMVSGENLAKGQRNVDEVLQSWLNSSGHRDNILNSEFKTISQKAFQTEDGTIHWVQLFSFN